MVTSNLLSGSFLRTWRAGLGIAVFGGLMLAGTAGAQTATWNGGGEDNNWTTGANWGGTPVQAGDALFFAGSTRLSSVNDFAEDTLFGGITFNAGAGAFTLSGNRITLGGDVQNLSSSAQILSLPLLLQTTRSFEAATANLTLSGAISGAGGLTKTGAQTLFLSGSAANTYLGLTSVTAGTLRLDKTSGVDAIAGNLEISGGGKVTFARSHQLNDNTLVTVSGAGSVFHGTGSNVGMTSNLVETIGGITMTGGTFNAGATSNWTITGAGSFTGGDGNTLFVGNSGARLTFGSLSISNMLERAGGTVSTANSFTLYGNSTTLGIITVEDGGLSLNDGRLNLRRGGGANAGSKLVLNGDVTVTGTLGSFITEDTSGGTSGMVRLELSGGTDPVDRVFNVAEGSALTINVEITNGASSAAGLTKTGNGTLTLSGTHAKSYTGVTRINGGSLVMNQTTGASALPGEIVINAGGTLQLNQTADVAAVAGEIVINEGGTLTMSANGQLAATAGIRVEGGTISSWNRTQSLAYYTQNSGGLTSNGNTGQFLVSGALTLNGGTTLTLNSLTSGLVPQIQADSVVLTGADILIGGNNGVGRGRSALNVGSGGLHMTGRKITLYRGNSSTVLNLNGNFTGQGSSLIEAGLSGALEPQLNLGTETRTFDIISGTTTINVEITGTGGLTKTGNGILSLTGNLNNTFEGTLLVSGGTLRLGQTEGTHAVSGLLEVETGGTLTFAANEQIFDETGIVMNGGTISAFTRTETVAFYTQNSGGFLTSGNTGNFIVTGLVTLSGGNQMTLNTSVSATPPNWSFGGAVLTGASILIGGVNGEGNPRTRLTIGGEGLVLAGRNITLNRAATGGTELYLLGNLTATGTSAITVASSGAIEPVLHLGSGTRTFQITSGTTTIGVTVMDEAAILKTGNGTLVMNTGSGYSGGTTVNAGVLRITNPTGSATGSGAFTLNSGATLSGSGRIAPSSGQNIQINGTLTIGTPNQTEGETLTLITTDLAALAVNDRVNIDLFSGQDNGGLNGLAAADRLILGSDTGVTLGAGSILSVTTSIPIDAANTAGWEPGTSWQIIDWSAITGGVTGSFSNLAGGNVDNYPSLPDLSPLGYFWDVSNLYTQGTIMVVIPEPSRMLLLVAGMSALLVRRRRAVRTPFHTP
ncbi:autotransporter-associated beta strand repeat-containing protein [Prosthecobacter sp. SYSU 5D2]|uniref:beta strand repeat-containing protein n=1 Tax=Prosthecobacter sp. SYSU 5D2 TaxID=3134134 RepID=UPI0031FE717F